MKKQLLALLVLLMLCLLPCLAGAETGNTTKRFPEDFTDGKYTQSTGVSTYTKRRETLIGDPMENGLFPLADWDRLNVEIPDGMVIVGEPKREDGRITITIDLQASDWGKLILSANPYPYISFRYSLDCPDTSVYETHVGFSGGFSEHTVSYVTGLMEDSIRWDSDHLQAGNGEFVGEIIPSQSLLQPMRSGKSMNLIAWLDKDNPDVRRYEYFEVVFKIVDTEPFTIPFRYVTEKMLSATETASLPSGVTVKSTADGDITYRVSGSVHNVDVPVVLYAPDGADYMVVTQPEHFANERYPVTGGKASFTSQIHDGDATHEEQFTIAWYSSGGSLVDYGTFMFHAEPANYAAWPNYAEGWDAVPASRVDWDNRASGAGVTAQYTESTGDFHVDYNPNATITGVEGDIIVRVKAPSGAKYYRTNHSGGNNIMGRDDGAVNDQINFTAAQALQPVPEDGWIEIATIVPVEVITLGPLEVYLQTGEGDAWPYAGGITTIFWYEDEASANASPKDPWKKEYVSDTMGALCVTKRIDIVEDEEDITGPVQNITCVGGQSYRPGWRLRIRHFPHRGDRAHHYELVLENEYGVYQPLPGNMVFYIPYPSGHTYRDGHAYDSDGHEATYQLYHYNAEYTDCQPVTATPTAKGIRFEVNDLSPFVLDWSGYEGDMTLPDQGGNNGNDDGEHDDNNSGNDRRFHLHTFDMRPGHQVDMRGIRAFEVQASYKGNSIVRTGHIENLILSIDPEMPLDRNNGGITLTDGALVDMLIVVCSNDLSGVTLDNPVLHLQNGARVGMLMVSKELADRLHDWLSYDEVDCIDMIVIGNGDSIPFRELVDN